MPIYRSAGKLTGTIKPENLAAAQEYLSADQMARYLDEPLRGAVESVEWRLGHDGGSYEVTAFAARELTAGELAELARWTSGQNSDGLGEGFEQQDFAWEPEDCGECGYNSGWGCECGQGSMISFDWETNDSAFSRA